MVFLCIVIVVSVYSFYLCIDNPLFVYKTQWDFIYIYIHIEREGDKQKQRRGGGERDGGGITQKLKPDVANKWFHGHQAIIYVVYSISFQTFLYRHLKLSETLENSLCFAIHLMR